MLSSVVEPENYISQIAFPKWEALAEDQRENFPPLKAFDTGNLSNGASAASAAQNCWDLALRTATAAMVLQLQSSSSHHGRLEALAS